MKAINAVDVLIEKFPGISGIKTCRFWNGNANAIHLGNAAEGGTVTASNGKEIRAANYWAEDPKETHYIFGVSRELTAALQELGFYAEWNDAGTLLAFED